MARVVRNLTVLPATHAFIRERYYPRMDHAVAIPAEEGPVLSCVDTFINGERQKFIGELLVVLILYVA